MERKMPKDFYWGGSVSSFQTEGHRNEGGKGVCIYDVRPMNPEFSDWNDAIDEYTRYDEDIALMKGMGFNFYRFSICWSRIIPNGTLDEPVNEEGVKFYSDLIDKLLAAGIEPMITLVHFDMPYHLVKNYNGFASRYVVDCFERYAKVCIERFGDRVKHWMSFNEQNLHSMMLRVSNAEEIPEGVSLPKHLYQVNHNVMMAHCKAVRALREMQPDAKFCGMGAITNIYAYDNSPENNLFATQAYNLLNGYLVDTFAQGKYPEEAVLTMNKIAHKIEGNLDYASILRRAIRTADNSNSSEAICMSVAEIAANFNVSAIIAFTETGATAKRMSRYRPHCPIIAPTPSDDTVKKLALNWGVKPVLCKSMKSREGLMDLAMVIAKENGISAGEQVIVTGGTPGVSGLTSYLEIVTIK